MNPATKSIVIVEDELSYAEALVALLTRHLDCPVHLFLDPVDAVAGLPGLNPGVIVTDYHMPHLNGVEFIREAAPRVPETVFLMMSGQNVAAFEPGLATLAPLRGLLSKPFSWRKLAEEIQRVWPAGSQAPALRLEKEQGPKKKEETAERDRADR